MSSKYYYLNEGFVIAHAGLNFNIPNPLTDLEKMLTIRTESNYKSKIGNRKLITGHTPITLDKVKLSLSTDLIRIDGGCVYYKQVQGLGYLVAIELNSYELFYLQNIDYDI
jgi:serine/threonine protein phosphatase 1